jgi:ribosomal protein S18 acetylase RimI-like enzyme
MRGFRSAISGLTGLTSPRDLSFSTLARPPSSYSLRAVTEDDFAWLWTLKLRTMRGYVEQTWGAWDEGVQDIYFRQAFTPSKLRIILVEGRDAGRLEVERLDRELFLCGIEIAPEFQRQGLGTTIINDLAAEARASRVPFRLQVLKVNPAQKLYQRLGFQIVGKTPTHLRMQLDTR